MTPDVPACRRYKALEGSLVERQDRGGTMGDVGENKAVIRRFVEEVQNNKNWDVFDELSAKVPT
jgi:hypothetical protein